jgi:hypothetical protein
MFDVLVTIDRALGALFGRDGRLDEIKKVTTGGMLVRYVFTKITQGTERMDAVVTVLIPKRRDDFATHAAMCTELWGIGEINKLEWSGLDEVDRVEIDYFSEIQLPLHQDNENLIVGRYYDEVSGAYQDRRNILRIGQYVEKEGIPIGTGGTLVTAVFTNVNETTRHDHVVTALIPERFSGFTSSRDLFSAVHAYIETHADQFYNGKYLYFDVKFVTQILSVILDNSRVKIVDEYDNTRDHDDYID